MIAGRDKGTGRLAVALEVGNYRDLIAAEMGILEPANVRRARIRGFVDTGVSHLVLPGKTIKELGLKPRAKIKVRCADGRRVARQAVDDVYLEILGRHGTFSAIVEPGRINALIGAIVLEAFDLLSDCNQQCLVPRDPNFVTSEIG